MTEGIGNEKFDIEGRTQNLEFENFYIINTYVPNASRGLKRLDYRMEWDEQFRKHIQSLNDKKPVIWCGDLNVAHQPIDLKNPKTNVYFLLFIFYYLFKFYYFFYLFFINKLFLSIIYIN